MTLRRPHRGAHLPLIRFSCWLTASVLFYAACETGERSRPDASQDTGDFGCDEAAALNYQQDHINGGRCLYGGEVITLFGPRFEGAFSEEELFEFALAYGSVDADDNGCLTAMEHAAAPAPHVDAPEASTAMDHDQDGCTTADEWFVFRVITEEGAQLFNDRLDTSGDGTLQQDEHAAALPFDIMTQQFLYALYPGATEDAVTRSSFLVIYSGWARERYSRPSLMWAND